MLVEKVPWCTHEGGVYTIHVDSTGKRFATGGADSQVKVWSMAPVVDVRKEQAGPLLLAALSDHTSAINTVRFSKSGKFLASGSDDRMICIFEEKGGAGSATLGASAANVENWRTRYVLRGHSNNVVDLGWSPHDSLLASASLDNTVCIWDMAAGGQRLKTLDLHNSFVKGLAWDPVGTYLATQSEDKSVAIWRCDDWSVVAVVRAPYARMVTMTFSTRMSWSPDGTFLATGNSYQGSSHAAVVIKRGRWQEEKEHMLVSGHQGCVVSVAFNPRLFHLPKKGGAAGEVEEKLCSVFMLGSQDKRVSVWTAAHARPLMVGRRFFKSQVTDLAWSPDGYTALAASNDGSVACFQYAASELGKPHSQEELDSLFQELYGSARGAPGRRLFAESADLLALEEAAQAASGAGPARGGPAAAFGGAATPSAGWQQAGVGALPQAMQQQHGGHGAAACAERTLQPTARHNLDALSARLSGRMGGGEVQVGFDAPAPAEGAAGRKRLAPEPVGRSAPALSTSAELMPPPPPRPMGTHHEAKRSRAEPAAAAASGGGRAAAASGHAAGAAAAAPVAAASAAGGPPRIMLRGSEKPAEVVADLGLPPRLFEDPASPSGTAGASEARRQLHITNRERQGAAAAGSSHTSSSSSTRWQAEVVCQQGKEVVWRDTLRGAAVAACGTHNFAAVGMADGHLLLYSAAGRHLSAPLKLGRGIALLACDSAWRLLALTCTGTLRLFDCESLRSLLTASVAPLLEEGGCTVLDARLSRMGVPLVTLSNSRAYVWSGELEGWACVADESFAASQYMPLLSLPNQGEISSLQAQVLRASIPRTTLPGLQVRGAASAALASRSHLEASLSTALALQSAQEYRRWLLAYARFLTEQADAARLAELCSSLLGTGQGGGGAAEAAAACAAGDDADMANADASEAPAAAGALVVASAGSGMPGTGGEVSAAAAWQPTVLGLSKWQLLRDVVREMSRNRVLQHTTQRYHDALQELERAADTARQQSAAAAPPAALPPAPA